MAKILKEDSELYKDLQEIFELIDSKGIRFEFDNHNGITLMKDQNRFKIKEDVGGVSSELPPMTECKFIFMY